MKKYMRTSLNFNKISLLASILMSYKIKTFLFLLK